MKIVAKLLVVFILFIACNKSGIDKGLTGNWELQKMVFSGPLETTVYPGKDSAVSLKINENNTYQTALNGTRISEGTYVVSQSKSNNQFRDLTLNGLKETGIFNQLIVSQVVNSQVGSSDVIGFIVTLEGNSLILTPDAVVPGGKTYYYFTRF